MALCRLQADDRKGFFASPRVSFAVAGQGPARGREEGAAIYGLATELGCNPFIWRQY